jgi:hypothetical protein
VNVLSLKSSVLCTLLSYHHSHNRNPLHYEHAQKWQQVLLLLIYEHQLLYESGLHQTLLIYHLVTALYDAPARLDERYRKQKKQTQNHLPQRAG